MSWLVRANNENAILVHRLKLAQEDGIRSIMQRAAVARMDGLSGRF